LRPALEPPYVAAMLRRVLLWLMLVGLTPAGPELVETIVHFAREGDFAHAVDERHTLPPAQQEEHGCSVLCHACRCHGPTSPSREVPRGPEVDAANRVALVGPARHLFTQTAPAPQDPPPIA